MYTKAVICYAFSGFKAVSYLYTYLYKNQSYEYYQKYGRLN